jgi:hypothetical protein
MPSTKPPTSSPRPNARLSPKAVLKKLDGYGLVAFLLSVIILTILPPLVAVGIEFFGTFGDVLDWLFSVFLDTQWIIEGDLIPAGVLLIFGGIHSSLSFIQFVLSTVMTYAIAGSANGVMLVWAFSHNQHYSQRVRQSLGFFISLAALVLIYWNRLPFIDIFEIFLIFSAFLVTSVAIAALTGTTTRKGR